MSDNLPTNVQYDTNQNGTVTFATEVVSTIAGLAANEVDGVASMYGSSSGVANILSRKSQTTKSFTKGVKIDLNEQNVNVQISIVIDYGWPAPEVAGSIQENVKKAIETMAGLHVGKVDVHIQGISFDREQREAKEIEEQQRILLQKQQDTDAIGGERAPDAIALSGDDYEDDADFDLVLEDVDEDETETVNESEDADA